MFMLLLLLFDVLFFIMVDCCRFSSVLLVSIKNTVPYSYVEVELVLLIVLVLYYYIQLYVRGKK
jgi:hypothetical protein